jgi:hypothetical protein
MPPAPIFSANFLALYLPDLKLSSVTDIRKKTLILQDLITELHSGKIGSLKEEEFKSRFINSIFGDVLGFNYGNSKRWQLREEKKSVVDGTKADAALGYFYQDKEQDDVRVVIEIKDANTDLDSAQNRPDKQSPVEQAFSYVPKAGGKCKWVIVSNFNEIRFYLSNDMSKYQLFQLKDLTNELTLKEFLFLFHKDRFINEEASPTEKLLDRIKSFQPKDDKPLHIIDKIYSCLKRFEGLDYVDPPFIVSIYPFNILDEHVWHYENRTMQTLNPEIYALMKEVSVADGKVVLSQTLQSELVQANVSGPVSKLAWSFKFLNHCLIEAISAVKDYKQVGERNKNAINFSHRSTFGIRENEGIVKSIHLSDGSTCECMGCSFRTFKFDKLLSKLKAGHGNEECNTLDYAYGNYLIASNNYKTCYNILKGTERSSKGKEGKEITYYLTKQNLKLLHNLILDYDLEDGKDILREIRAIDLDKVIYDEIEFSVDKEVRQWLISMKEDAIIYKIQDKIDDITFEVSKLKKFFENGGISHSGSSLPLRLSEEYMKLYRYTNANFIFYDVFIRYKTLTEKVFKGFVESYLTRENGLRMFNDFFLTEAILHIRSSNLVEILKDVKHMNVVDGCVDSMLDKLVSFTSSCYKDGFFGDPLENTLISDQLSNYRFKDKFTEIFSNLFIILARLEITKEQFAKCKAPLLKFLKIENALNWSDIKYFAEFIYRKGGLFEGKELMELLNLAVNKDTYSLIKYSDLIHSVPQTLKKFHGGVKIENKRLIEMLILKCTSENGHVTNYNKIVYLADACNDECKELLFSAFEAYLDRKFDEDFYSKLLISTSYDFNRKGYFKLYSEEMNRIKRGQTFKFGKQKLSDNIFINYVILVYKLGIDFEREELKIFTGLNPFESWLLNPVAYDYGNFEAKWLIDIDRSVILDRLKGNKNIGKAIEIELLKEYNPVLAKYKYKYFN